MKYLSTFLISICISTALSAQGDAISAYFNQYVEDERFTTVFVSPKMFQLFGQLDLEGLEDKEAEAALKLAQDLKAIRILSTEQNGKNFYTEALKKLDISDYEPLVRVRDEGENVHMLIRQEGPGDIIDELLILVGSDEEFTLISIMGLIKLKEISNLAKAVDMDELKYLEHVDKK